ncbi:hypothetical protein G7064_19695 [Hymenobacter sp. HDW8]|nr:hypothetical protein G7064_19695 [Hymenobacter sp. HDW8]
MRNCLLRVSLLSAIILFASGLFSISLQAQTLAGSGNKLNFNGFSTYINCGTSNRGITQQVSVEAWVRTTSSSYQWVAGKYSNSLVEEKGFHLYTNNGAAYFNGRTSVGLYMSSGASRTRVDDGRWHHLAGVCNINSWQIYVDGVLENSATYPFSRADLTTSSALAIGEYIVQAENLFLGDIDEIRVWRTALTEDQIRTNMCRKISPVPAELVAYYNFDQTSGTIAVDKGSVPVNGTLSNFASAALWQPSGAAIGDASTFAYGTDLRTTRLRIKATNGDSAIVNNIRTQTDGVQLYVVNQEPSIKPAAVTSAAVYFGVFSRGLTGAYDFRLRPVGGLGCSGLSVRPANDGIWSTLTTTTSTPTSVLATQQTYRAEYMQTGIVLNVPVVAISGDSVICLNSNTQLTAAAAGAQSYRWSNGATTPTISVSQPGTYTVTATFTAGCTTTRSRQVVLRASSPVPAFALGPDTTVCEGTPLLLRAPVGNAYSYLWSDGSTGSTLLARQGGTYSVTVRSGCNTQTASRTLTAQLCVPNIITPNKDGRNDAFVVASYSVGEWSLAIYNRWGKEVYQTERYLNDWGTSAAPGVYYYMLRRSSTNSAIKGWLEVVR